MLEERDLIGGGELVVEGHEHRPLVQGGVGGDGPPRLVAHQDGDPVSRLEVEVPELADQPSTLPPDVEVAVPARLSPAGRFDEGDLGLELN